MRSKRSVKMGFKSSKDNEFDVSMHGVIKVT